MATRPLSGRTVLVTGSTGFIGLPVCRGLLEAGASVRGASRLDGPHPVAEVEPVHVPDLLDSRAVRTAVEGVDAVVHLAARVHIMREHADDPLAQFRRVNVEGTAMLCQAAAAAGVRSVVLASTVKAVGEATTDPWTEATPPAPVDPYGRSKLEAELTVREWAERHGFQAVILRFPLVYGPRVKGNVHRLFSLVDRGVPLPFGAVANRRSLLYVENLVASVRAVLETPLAGVETFFVSDGRDLSLPELVIRIGEALGRPARLLPVPPGLLRLASRLGDLIARVGPTPFTSAEIERLIGSLAIDSSKLSLVTGHRAPHTVEDGLRRTAEWYRTTEAARS